MTRQRKSGAGIPGEGPDDGKQALHEALLVEIGGTTSRWAVLGDSGVGAVSSCPTQSHSSLSDLLRGVAAQLDVDGTARRRTHVRIAAAACIFDGGTMSDHVPWLRGPWAELTKEAGALGFRSIQLHNDAVAAMAGLVEGVASTDGGSAHEAKAPIGILTVGTGLGSAVAHAIDASSYLIVGSEAGFASVDRQGTGVRIRDSVCGEGLRNAVGQDPVTRDGLTAFLSNLVWVVRTTIVTHKLRTLVLTGGVMQKLRSEHGLSAEAIAAELRAQSVGSIQPIVDRCRLAIETNPDLALAGLAAIERRCSLPPDPSSEGPLVLTYR